MLIEKAGSMGFGRSVVRSDKQGLYRFDGLWPDHLYSTLVSEIGWVESIGDDVHLKQGRITVLSPLKLRRAQGSVAGRVVDVQGNPIAGAAVSDGDVRGVSDSKGAFRLTGVERDGTINVNSDSEHFGLKSFRGLPQDLVVVVQEPKPRYSDNSAVGASGPAVGSPAQELISGMALDGKTVRLADFKSHVVVLDFWGIHCGPCVGALPAVQRIWKQYASMGVVVIGMHNAGDNLAEIRKFVKENDLQYPIVLDADDENGSFGKTFRAYGVFSIPSVVVIDQKRNIAAYNVSAEDAFQKVGELLAKQQ